MGSEGWKENWMNSVRYDPEYVISIEDYLIILILLMSSRPIDRSPFDCMILLSN